MNGKALVMLLLAVLSGLGAMYGTSRLLAKDKVRVAADMQDVMVASRDLKVEEVLKPDMVKVVKMSRSELPVGTFTSYKDVEDRWVQFKTLEGEPILDRKLAPKGSPAGLVSRIPKGMRAFALDVSESTGVSGFVLPDHRVDVIQVLPKKDGKTETDAETILQDVLVLASWEQVFTRPEDRSLQSRTVTVAVTPDQVDTLVAARTRGPLSLALRGLQDHEQIARKRDQVKEPDPAVLAVAVKPVEPTPPPPSPPKSGPVVKEPSPADTKQHFYRRFTEATIFSNRTAYPLIRRRIRTKTREDGPAFK